MPFSHLPPVIGEALGARGYDALTPVQQAVTEPEAAGRDLIVSAQTGSGKTVAFGLALAPKLLDAVGGTPLSERPLVLVIAPTRELALQVSRELGWLYGQHGVRINAIAPGLVKTDFAKALWENPKARERVEGQLPMRRIGEPEDIAGGAVYLASPAARWTTGQMVVIDGGATI